MNLQKILCVILGLSLQVSCAQSRLKATDPITKRDVSDSSSDETLNEVRRSIIKSNYKKNEIKTQCEAQITELRNAFSQIILNAKKDPANFEQTVLAYETEGAQFYDLVMPLTFMGSVSTESALRDEGVACEELVNALMVETTARKDLYAALRGAVPRNSEEARLKSETLLNFEKNGLSLPDDQLAKLTALRAQLSKLESQFAQNLNEDVSTVTFTAADLEGVPEYILKRFKKDAKGDFIVTTKSTDYLGVVEEAVKPETRKRILFAYLNRAAEKNTKLLNEAVVLRQKIAAALGLKTWADYKIKGRMAVNAANVQKFLGDLKKRLGVRTQQDLKILLAAKKQMEDPKAKRIEPWDIGYFANQVKKTKYNLNDELVSQYFPKDTVMEGMFKVYSTLLHVHFEEVKGATVWHPDVKMYAVREKSNNDIIAYFYTDLFPREGKYGHAAAFSLIMGRQIGSNYSQPVSAIVANMSPPTADTPSLLTHDDVETLFHEFGHIMHQILTRAPYASLSGSNTTQDFVEAPSQMLENWVWDKKILGLISGHYKNPSESLPDSILTQMLAARNFNKGYAYSRQLVLGLTDLTIHTKKGALNVDVIYDKMYADILGVTPLKGAHFMATFGHMMGGYDAGYYGYLWSEVYAADMFTAFEGDLLNENAGLRYRREILEKGHMIPEIEIVEKFLGRKSNYEAFYKKLGI